MMDIKEIAEQVSKRIYTEDGVLLSKYISEKFAEALVAEIQQRGEPVATVPRLPSRNAKGPKVDWHDGATVYAGMQLFTFPPSIEALEDKVAEACAALCDMHWGAATRIRSGEWKKFRKGE